MDAMASRSRSNRRAPNNRSDGSNGVSKDKSTETQEASASSEGTGKKVRDLSTRIAEKKRQLEQLEAQEFRQRIKEITKNHPECKSLARDLEIVRKARVVFADWGHDDVLDSADQLYVQIEDSLKAKVAQLANEPAAPAKDGDQIPEMPAPEDAGAGNGDDLLA